jgi:hypothetical protein
MADKRDEFWTQVVRDFKNCDCLLDRWALLHHWLSSANSIAFEAVNWNVKPFNYIYCVAQRFVGFFRASQISRLCIRNLAAHWSWDLSQLQSSDTHSAGILVSSHANKSSKVKHPFGLFSCHTWPVPILGTSWFASSDRHDWRTVFPKIGKCLWTNYKRSLERSSETANTCLSRWCQWELDNEVSLAILFANSTPIFFSIPHDHYLPLTKTPLPTILDCDLQNGYFLLHRWLKAFAVTI